jgi:hypothetical protein
MRVIGSVRLKPQTPRRPSLRPRRSLAESGPALILHVGGRCGRGVVTEEAADEME